MTNEEICVWLKAEAEPKFQKFTSGLIPGTDPIIGVRGFSHSVIRAALAED